MKKSLALFAISLAAVLNAATPSTSLVYKNTTTNALTGNIVAGNNTTISATGNGTITATALTGNITGNPTVSGNLTVGGGTATINGGAGAINTLTLGGNATSDAARVRMLVPSTKYNWQIGAQQNVDNGFEITPSTAVGGTTFSSPAIQIAAATGNTTINYGLSVGGNLTVSGTGNNAFRGPIRWGNTSYPGYNGYITETSTASQLIPAITRNLIGTTGNNQYTIANAELGAYAAFELGTDIRWFAGSGTFTTGQTITPTELMRLTQANGNLLIGTTTDTGQKLQVNGDGKFAGSVYAEKSGAGIAGQSTGAITQFTTVNSTTYNVTTGSGKVFVVQLASGDAALCYASYKSSTITILGSDGTIVNSSSPDTGQLGIYKSANDHVISFKTGSNALTGGYASWGFCFVGNPIISIANP